MPGSDASRRLSAIAAKLREVGDRQLMNDSRRALRVVAEPLKAEVRLAALRDLPRSGGLNRHVAGQNISVSVPLGVRVAAIRLRMPFIDATEANQGFIRHPVFGNRDVWVQQEIPNADGFWTHTLEHAQPEVTAALEAVMAKLEGELVIASE